ncbi:MAG: tryptophan synthase subunit alpha [Dehalococcoidia bacterium]|nr:tryptophan synthase subunit alpha [Dehalococcoidia bacterium]
MNRLSDTFTRLRNDHRTGIAMYLTVGWPEADATESAAQAALDAGADIIELGVPFSDPLADGATIQRSSAHALQAGVHLDTCLETARSIRAKNPSVPILFMGYYNPFLRFGLERFAKEAVTAGIDGVIVPDLPPEESEPLDDAISPFGLDLIYLLAPTSPPERVERVVAKARGFIYCVSLTGVTGARAGLSEAATGLLKRVRERASVPLALGFGISSPHHVVAVKSLTDAVIVGSAFVDLLEQNEPSDRQSAIREYVGALVEAAKLDRLVSPDPRPPEPTEAD